MFLRIILKLTLDVLVEEHIEVHIIIYFAIWGAQISISFVTAGLINFFFVYVIVVICLFVQFLLY